jgi:GNAT acetyltransferase-like protein
LCVAGRAVPAALSMTTMTHPDYRGRGLFPQLGQRLYARLVEAGVTLVYGFPNASSHRGFVGQLGWRDIYEVPTLRLPLAAARGIDAPPTVVRAVARPDARFDRLWERMRGRFSVWSCRDARHLAWRLSECPTGTYVIAAWQEGEEIRGYAAVKRYQQESLDLVDLMAEDDTVARGLIGWTLSEARKASLPAIATWCSPHAPWRLVLEGAGFGVGAPVTFMGTRVFARSASIAEASRAWGFSMLDSDVY